MKRKIWLEEGFCLVSAVTDCCEGYAFPMSSKTCAIIDDAFCM